MAEVPGQGHGLQEHFGQKHRGADIEVCATSTEPRDLAGQDPEIEMRAAADRGRVAGGMHVDDVGAHRDMHGGRNLETPRRGEDREALELRAAPSFDVTANRSAETETVAIAKDDGPVDLFPGLPSHSELAAAEDSVHLLGGLAGDRGLEVVNDPRAVERDRGDEAALHQVDDQGSEPDLENVRAHPPDERALPLPPPHDRRGHRAQLLRGEDPGEGRNEGGEPGPAGVGPSEVRNPHLAHPRLKRVGPDPREIERPAGAAFPGRRLRRAHRRRSSRSSQRM